MLASCVRPSVCLSVCHKPVLYRNYWTNRAGFFLQGGLLPPIPHCVVRKVWYLQNLGLTSGIVPNSGLGNFRHGKSVELVDDTYTTAGSHGCLLQVSQL